MTEELEVLHVGDSGTQITLTVTDQAGAIVDVSGATELTFRFRKPDGTTFQKTGSLVTDGKDGKVKYVIETDVLDMPGTWVYQLFVDLPSGEWTSREDLSFDVEDIIPIEES